VGKDYSTFNNQLKLGGSFSGHPSALIRKRRLFQWKKVSERKDLEMERSKEKFHGRSYSEITLNDVSGDTKKE